MRVQAFQGQSLEEILPQVREQLGANAVILSQKPLISGGIGGFFGKRMIEIIAADRMPTDEELIELEESGFENAVGKQFGQPQQQGESGLNLTDDWDPADDEELAGEYGGIFGSLTNHHEDADQPAAPSPTPSGEVEPASDSGLESPSAPVSAPAGAAVAAPVAQAAPATPAATVAQAAAPTGDFRLQTTPYGKPSSEQAHVVPPATAATPPISEADTAAANQAAAAGTLEELDIPQLPAEGASAIAGLPVKRGVDSARMQAQRLADRAQQAIAAATQEIEYQVAAEQGSFNKPTNQVSSNIRPLQTATAPALAQPQEHIAQHLRVSASPAESVGGGFRLAAQPVQDERPRTSLRAVKFDQELIDEAHAIEAEMVDKGVDVTIARSIVETVVDHRRPFSPISDIRHLAREVIAERLPVETGWLNLNRAHRLAIVGRSGSGKSTIIAKLAESYMYVANYKVAIISILADKETVGARQRSNDPLLERRDLDVRFVQNSQQMADEIARVSDVDLILIDTPGATYHDMLTFRTVAGCLAAARVDDVHVALPLSTSEREAAATVERFRDLTANRMIISKVDESSYIGPILNLGFRHQLPITYLSDGPGVPEDIRSASANEIAALIVSPRGEN